MNEKANTKPEPPELPSSSIDVVVGSYRIQIRRSLALDEAPSPNEQTQAKLKAAMRNLPEEAAPFAGLIDTMMTSEFVDETRVVASLDVKVLMGDVVLWKTQIPEDALFLLAHVAKHLQQSSSPAYVPDGMLPAPPWRG